MVRQPVSGKHAAPKAHTKPIALIALAMVVLPATISASVRAHENGRALASAQGRLSYLDKAGLGPAATAPYRNRLSEISTASWGPFPGAWVENEAPGYQAVVQQATHRLDALTAITAANLRRAGNVWVGTVKPWIPNASQLEIRTIRHDHSITAMRHTTTLWSQQNAQWLTAIQRLSKLSGGLSHHRPKSVETAVTTLKKALANPERNAQGVAQAHVALNNASHFFAQTPSWQADHIVSEIKALRHAAADLTPKTLSTPTSAEPGSSGSLTSEVQQYLATRQSVASAAVLNLDTGYSWSFQPNLAYDTASIVKATIMATLLWQAEQHQTPLTNQEATAMVPMIEDSSNSAATTLWDIAGRSAGIQQFLDAAGMRSTVPGRGGYWGLTQTTVTDQVKLMTLFAQPNGLLDARSQAYAQNLMTHIVGFENWGVNSGAPDGSTVALKNGWLPLPSGLGWEINSVGYVNSPHGEWAIAILSNRNPSEAYGIQTVQHIAQLISQSQS